MKKIEKENNKIDNLMNVAMKNLSNIIDVNTVIGKPINTLDGSIIIPISKVTMGFMTGGGEYGDIKYLKNNENIPFAGGNGAIVSMKPSGFLIDNGKGVKLVTITNEPYEKLFETASEFLEKYREDKNV